MPVWSVLLVAATAAHAGFQLTVTTLVYPALLRVRPTGFAAAHTRHSRAVVPLVSLLYGGVLLGVVGAVVQDPSSLVVWSTALATAVALLTTALRAAPLHGRLGRRGPEPELVGSLVRADRVRCAAAVLAALSAAAYALTR